AGEGGLDVEQGAAAAVGIGDVPDRAAARGGAVRARGQRGHVDDDVGAEIDPALVYGVAQVGEGACAVGARVGAQDEAAAPAHQLVQAEVLEVAAVGQVHELAAGVGAAEQLGQQPAAEERRIV